LFGSEEGGDETTSKESGGTFFSGVPQGRVKGTHEPLGGKGEKLVQERTAGMSGGVRKAHIFFPRRE